MIKTIRLKNFQSHVDTVLPLDQFNAFIGPSSSGKTAAATRALCFVFYGDWDKTFPNDKEKPTAIAIEFDDGDKVVRTRKGTKNKARWFHNGKWDEEWMQDFGSFIPGLFDKFNVRPIKLNKKTINLNFSLQDDPPFMITESRPMKAQWLGRLYGAHAINNMMRLMGSEKKDLDRERKRLQGEVEPLQVKYDSMPDPEPLRTGLSKLQGGLKRLNGLRALLVRRERLRGSEASVEGQRDLLNANLEGMKRALLEVEKLQRLAFRVEKLKKSQGVVEESRELADLDTVGLREILLKTKDLWDLRVRRKLLRYKTKEFDESRALLSYDLPGFRKQMDELKCLQVLSLWRNSLQEKESGMDGRLAQADKDIKNIQKDFKKHLLKDGKCPVCTSKPGKITAAELAKNARQVLGAF